MTNLREAAQMALDALEEYEDGQKVYFDDEIEALRAALAQPEQEPVAWVNKVNGTLYYKNEWDDVPQPEKILKPLYTAPLQREWQSLTEEDLSVCDEDGVLLARYWEAKLKEKNV